eukprot:TRINITY_DN6634_c0_g1_i1.p1 TRINITY_DN6634_c0_g1~~TRINITY_DN6634_c0_g1_i1.p1  ORF type:complete len:158 (-),score=27.89 TRINITY_DN6634_c0_g1_i1:234-707(-)
MASDPAFAEDKMRNCFTLLQKLRKHKFGWVFNEPVDPVALNIPDYFDVIKNPMDFSTIQNKMEAGMYSNIEEFAEDARLTFENALLYNQPKSEIGTMTKTLLELFEKEYSKIALGDSKTRRILRHHFDSFFQSRHQKQKLQKDKETIVPNQITRGND